MDINPDFTATVVQHEGTATWEDSPLPGVTRRRLDRIGTDESTERVTTVVRFAPGSNFSSHTHVGGEEFLVLDGVFDDDYGSWPAGSYVRNPPTSKHTPGSRTGCTLFVKLCQFQPNDRTFVHANIDKLGAVSDRFRKGVQVSPLYKDACEDVRIEHWDAHSTVTLDTDGGAEYLLLEGECRVGEDTLMRHSWLRLPHGSNVSAVAGTDGARLWVKTGHLHGL